MYFIIDKLEHGNGGVYGSKVLSEFNNLDEALDKKPSDYDVIEKEYGFWPIISDNTVELYHWVADDEYHFGGSYGKWVRTSLKRKLGL